MRKQRAYAILAFAGFVVFVVAWSFPYLFGQREASRFASARAAHSNMLEQLTVAQKELTNQPPSESKAMLTHLLLETQGFANEVGEWFDKRAKELQDEGDTTNVESLIKNITALVGVVILVCGMWLSWRQDFRAAATHREELRNLRDAREERDRPKQIIVP